MKDITGRQVAVHQSQIRRFVLNRLEDMTGMTGSGVVAHGVHFLESNLVSLVWIKRFRAISIYQGVEELEYIHSHNGRTEIIWLD